MISEAEKQERMFQLHVQMEEHIEQFGQSLIGVGPTSREEAEDRAGYFTYTIGNHAKGLPELLIVGYNGDIPGYVLNAVGEIMRTRGSRFEDGEILQLEDLNDARVKIINTNERALEFIVQAQVHYGDDVAVQQVILSDKTGLFPGEDGCNPSVAEQPIFAQH